MRLPKNNQLAVVCAAIGASLYGGASLATLLASINLIVIPIGIPNPISALLLAIVAMVLVGAFKHLLENKRDGYAFLVVGAILAGLLFALQFIILGTNALGWMLKLEDWLAWKVVDDLTPQIWLFPIVLPIVGLPWLIDHGNDLKKKEVKGND